MQSGVLGFAMKQTWRDLRAGDLRLLVLAVVVAVAAISSVGFLSDRVSRALERDASRMLGADLVVETPGGAPQSWIDRAKQDGLQAVRTWRFPSMVGNSEVGLQLAAIKAVEDGYPLRGEMRTAPDVLSPDEPIKVSPLVGSAWVDPQLLALTGLAVGDQLQVGDANLTISRVITYEPDRGMQFVNVAPRVMIRAEDLESSGLLGPGSRVTHALLVAGDESVAANYRKWLEPQLNQAQQILSVSEGRPEIMRALDRANEFLTLVVMIAVLIAAVAIALGARRFSQRQQQGIAVMRCFGATQGTITKLLSVEFILVALIGSLIGLLVGWTAQLGLASAMQGLIADELPGVGWQPAAQGIYAGFWLLLAFALPPVQSLRRISAVQILRQEVPAFPLHSIAGYLVAFLGFAILMWWIAGNPKYGFGLAAGFVLAAVIFGLLALLVLKLVDVIRHRLTHRPAWRFALAGLVRRKASSISQISALAVGMMAILLLTIVRTDLLDGWQQTLPPDAPNRFLINIQPDQVDPVRQALLSGGFKNLSFYPMIRGRVVALNEKSVSVNDFESPRAQNLLQRDFNLSYAPTLEGNGEVVAGRAIDPEAFEVSIETDVARALGISIGDKVTFEVAGEPVAVTVTSLRKVNWDSMQPNFFALLSPKALANEPQTFITSLYVPVEKSAVTQALIKQFPNLTVFDVGAMIAQLQSVLDRVSVAIQALFGFAILAGLVVLAAALSASRDERVRESALLRALGATNQQLSRAQRIELLMIGALSGLMAAAGATLAAWALSVWVFQFAMQWSLTPWILGLAVCMPGAWLAGSVVLRGVLRTPPLLILRNE